MIRAHGQIHIQRPPEQVFDFLADLSNEPEWNPDARDIVKVSEGEIGLGTVYTETVKPLGFFEVRIHEYDRRGGSASTPGTRVPTSAWSSDSRRSLERPT